MRKRGSGAKVPIEVPPKKRMYREVVFAQNSFELLSDDLVIVILCKISASARSPCDLIRIISTCKRFKHLGMDPLILANASGKSIWIRAKSWSDSAHRFLTSSADAGNTEACYFLGMIEFYCLGNHTNGVTLLTRAAQASHPEALYSLAIIIFKSSGNNSSGSPAFCHDSLYRAATLCLQSAALGHADAMREIGYCSWNGIGFPIPAFHAISLILSADRLELKNKSTSLHRRNYSNEKIISNYGFYKETGRRVHPANRFMVEWWWLTDEERIKGKEGLLLCSHMLCGRRETRSNEFWRCSICGETAYCSFACQEIHWRMEHASMCMLFW